MSSTIAPWLGNDKVEMNGSETHHVESGKEKQTIEPGEQSTATSSTVNGLDTTEPPSRDDGSGTKEGPIHEPQEPIHQTSGIEFFLITLSLILSIFLFSLDTVSPTVPSPIQTSCSRIRCKSTS